jgi:hypothetical protein
VQTLEVQKTLPSSLSKLKQGVSLDQEAECYRDPNQPIRIPKKVEDAIDRYLGKKSKEKYDTKSS